MADREAMAQLFAAERFDRVVHLAAQAGVRYSLENPHAYIDSNIVGFTQHPRRLPAQQGRSTWSTPRAPASTAATRSMPFSEHDNVDHPVSLYAATKKANELMAHTYSHLFGLPDHRPALLHRVRPLGPARHGAVPVHQGDPGRPPIDVFNHGKMQRDFTYVDDIVEGVVRVLDRVATADPAYDAGSPTRRAATCRTGCSTSATTTR